MCASKLIKGRARRVRIGNTDYNSPNFRFMGNVGIVDLEDDRIPYQVGETRGFFRGLQIPPFGRTNAVRFQQTKTRGTSHDAVTALDIGVRCVLDSPRG